MATNNDPQLAIDILRDQRKELVSKVADIDQQIVAIQNLQKLVEQITNGNATAQTNQPVPATPAPEPVSDPPAPPTPSKTSTKKTTRSKTKAASKKAKPKKTGPLFKSNRLAADILGTISKNSLPDTIEEALNRAYPNGWAEIQVKRSQGPGKPQLVRTLAEDLKNEDPIVHKLVRDLLSNLRQIESNKGRATGGRTLSNETEALYKKHAGNMERVVSVVAMWGIK